jgi:hypothetical protein
VGKLKTSSDSKTDFSISVVYPEYHLNPSRTQTWASGTDGTWDIRSDHPLLTPEQRLEGWQILSMTAPDDPATPLPARVKFEMNKDGQVISVTFASIMGIDFPPAKQMILYRKAGIDEAVKSLHSK